MTYYNPHSTYSTIESDSVPLKTGQRQRVNRKSIVLLSLYFK
jgi:hypothetical protein